MKKQTIGLIIAGSVALIGATLYINRNRLADLIPQENVGDAGAFGGGESPFDSSPYGFGSNGYNPYSNALGIPSPIQDASVMGTDSNLTPTTLSFVPSDAMLRTNDSFASTPNAEQGTFSNLIFPTILGAGVSGVALAGTQSLLDRFSASRTKDVVKSEASSRTNEGSRARQRDIVKDGENIRAREQTTARMNEKVINDPAKNPLREQTSLSRIRAEETGKFPIRSSTPKDAGVPKDIFSTGTKEPLPVRGKVGGKIAGTVGTALAVAQIGSNIAETSKEYKPSNVKEYAGVTGKGILDFTGQTFSFLSGLFYRPKGADANANSGFFATFQDLQDLGEKHRNENASVGQRIAEVVGVGGYFNFQPQPTVSTASLSQSVGQTSNISQSGVNQSMQSVLTKTSSSNNSAINYGTKVLSTGQTASATATQVQALASQGLNNAQIINQVVSQSRSSSSSSSSRNLGNNISTTSKTARNISGIGKSKIIAR